MFDRSSNDEAVIDTDEGVDSAGGDDNNAAPSCGSSFRVVSFRCKILSRDSPADSMSLKTSKFDMAYSCEKTSAMQSHCLGQKEGIERR